MKPIRTFVVAALVACIGAGAAFAGPPGGCPPGQAKKGNCGRWFDDRYWRSADASDRAYDRGYHDGRWSGGWELGVALPRDAGYIVIRDYDRYHLSPPPVGHYYAEIDGRVLLVQAATQLVLEALIRN